MLFIIQGTALTRMNELLHYFLFSFFFTVFQHVYRPYQTLPLRDQTFICADHGC
jgi:hypothetical protein